MRKIQVMLVFCVIVAMLVGCSKVVNQNVADEKHQSTASFSEYHKNVAYDSNVVETSSVSTTKNTTTKSKELSTTATTTKTTTTKTQTTKQTTHNTTNTTKTTTIKQTTTAKPTTTKKPTTSKQTTTKKQTTEAPYFCDEGGTHHSCEVGQIGWVNSYETAQNKALEYIAENNTSGNFRVKECFYCGKFTAIVTLR